MKGAGIASPTPSAFRSTLVWHLTVLPIAAVLLPGAVALEIGGHNPLLHHMLRHVVLMSVVAPLVAALILRWRPDLAAGGLALVGLTVGQLVVLYSAHAPAVSARTMGAAGSVLGFVLLATAVGFWLAVLAQRSADRWRAIVALLLTGKLVCLLAVLLVFAPRPLYTAMAHASADSASAALADQQLAGLVMIAVCPIAYVGAAILIAARWLRDIERQGQAVLGVRQDA